MKRINFLLWKPKFKYFSKSIKYYSLPDLTEIKINTNTSHSWSVVEFDSQGNISFVEMPRATLYSKLKLSGRDIRVLGKIIFLN